jgi:hypothetical protein
MGLWAVSFIDGTVYRVYSATLRRKSMSNELSDPNEGKDGGSTGRTRPSLLIIREARAIDGRRSFEDGHVEVGDVYLTHGALYFIAYAQARIYGGFKSGGLLGAIVTHSQTQAENEDRIRKAGFACSNARESSWGMTLEARLKKYPGSLLLARNEVELTINKNGTVVVVGNGRDSRSFENLASEKIEKLRAWIAGTDFFEEDSLGAFSEMPSPHFLLEQLQNGDDSLRSLCLDKAPDPSRYVAVTVSNYLALERDRRRIATRNLRLLDERIQSEIVNAVDRMALGSPRTSWAVRCLGVVGLLLWIFVGFLFYCGIHYEHRRVTEDDWVFPLYRLLGEPGIGSFFIAITLSFGIGFIALMVWSGKLKAAGVRRHYQELQGIVSAGSSTGRADIF